MEPIADLHLHSTLSDGTAEPSEVIETAEEMGLDAIAFTDHDRVHKDLNPPLEVVNGIDVISGIELRVEPDQIGERVDLLGYGVTPSSELKSVLSKIQRNRKERAQHIVDLIEDETGVRINFEPTERSGRPDIARAVDDNPELEYTYEEAFNNLIGSDDPCYVSRDVPSFEYGYKLLKKDCKLVSLAHPYRYEKLKSQIELSKYLDGIECIYNYTSSVDRSDEMDSLAAKYFDLVITGGSDAHKPEDIGVTGLTEPLYKKFLDASELRYLSKFA